MIDLDYERDADDPPATITALVRMRVAPPRVRREPVAPTAEQRAVELADRVRWAAWNTKRSARSRAQSLRRFANRLDAIFGGES